MKIQMMSSKPYKISAREAIIINVMLLEPTFTRSQLEILSFSALMHIEQDLLDAHIHICQPDPTIENWTCPKCKFKIPF